jgi:S-layer protein
MNFVDSASVATSITVSGNAALTLNTNTATAVTSVNASANTGGLTYTTAGTTAETVHGSATAANILASAAGTVADTLIGGAGNDTIRANAGQDILTGNGGNDTFVINVPSVNSSAYATITDANAGDTIQMSGIKTFSNGGISLQNTAVFQDYVNTAIHNSAATNASWFQYAGNTYVVDNVSGGPSFVNGTDMIVKLAGTVDLSHATLNTTSGLIVLH